MVPTPDSRGSVSQRLFSQSLPKHPLWFRLALYFMLGVSLLNWFVVNRSSTLL